MKINRRNFIKLSGAGAFIGGSLLSAKSAMAQNASARAGLLPREALSDPLFYLSGEDFRKYIGTEFSLFTETGGTLIVLSDVTQIKSAKSSSRVKKSASNSPIAETFTLSFYVPLDGLTQATYRLSHSMLGEFNLFLVPEAGSKNLLFAVINRI